MLAGMIAFGLWFADPFSLLVASGTAGMHLAMLVGMLAGMAAAMPLRDWAAERLALRLPAGRPS
jgi:hypothetical protein